MSDEQKEGIVITAVVLLVLIAATLRTTWFYGMEPTVWITNNISILYEYVLFVLLPLLFYGVLRAFGIVKRLFEFERAISKVVSSK